MEIPEINMISDFEAGMRCLQNPSLISRFFPFSRIEKVPQVYSLWKWGALMFAVFVTFSSIIKRIKFIFIHFHTTKHVPIKNEEITEFSEDDDISLASSDDEQEEEDNIPTRSFRDQQHVDEDFSVKGSRLWSKFQLQDGQLGQRTSGGSWSEFSFGKNVVKLWEDSFGLSLDFNENLTNNDSDYAEWYFDNDQKISQFSNRVAKIPPMAMTSPAVVLTAGKHWMGEGVVLSCYDTRMHFHTPAFRTKWRSPAAKVTGIVAGSDGKVYIRDDMSGVVTVGDVRNVRMPLESVAESDGNTW